jgi:hypothetical protein
LGLVVDYRFSGKVLGGLLLLVMVVGAQESKQLICLFGGSSAPAHAHGTSSFFAVTWW